ncbi:MAG: hypothetical protein ABSG76_18400 [Xanthobacteraceae bacterium]
MIPTHYLTGYDQKTDVQKFSLPIPSECFASIKGAIKISEDDPEAFDSYGLSHSQAQDIAQAISHQNVPQGLAFYLETFAGTR